MANFYLTIICRDPPSTPERDRTIECERSRLRRLDMTGTDERCNSRSRSGTPSRSADPVPQPVFQLPAGFGAGHRDAPAPNLPPSQGDDPFQMDVAAEHHRVINLNNDMHQMQMPAGGDAQPLLIPNV